MTHTDDSENTAPLKPEALDRRALDAASRAGDDAYMASGENAVHDAIVAGIRAYLAASPAPQQQGVKVKALTLADLQRAHIERQEEWCPEQKPDLSFRGNEMAGEVGEACNVIKKLERERQGWRGSRATKEQLAEELADVIHTAVLCAITAGIDIEQATAGKFDATSEKSNLSTRLSALTIQEPASDLVVPAKLTYTNWRGETSERTITPISVHFAATEWHPEPQWLLRAFDHDKQAERDFALKDFAHPSAPAVPSGLVEALRECAEAMDAAAKIGGVHQRHYRSDTVREAASAIASLTAERDEARAEVERMTPQFVAYEYLESPEQADRAEAALARALEERDKLRADLAFADRQSASVEALLETHVKWEPGTIRVCPLRDAACPHGLACPYTDGYDCKPGWNSTLQSQRPE